MSGLAREGGGRGAAPLPHPPLIRDVTRGEDGPLVLPRREVGRSEAKDGADAVELRADGDLEFAVGLKIKSSKVHAHHPRGCVVAEFRRGNAMRCCYDGV